MDSDHLKSHSLWSATASMPVYPPLSANLSVEVCVIGAGIAGLTAAYQLARQGVSVAVIEALGVGEGETGHTTAHIAVPDDRYSHIEESYGGDAAKQVADSFAAAAELIESVVADEHIDCEFRRLDGFLFACNATQQQSLEAELAAARRAGVAVGRTDRLPFDARVDGPFLCFPNQAQFHPLRYLAGLARAVEKRRAAIYCGSRALDIEETADGVNVKTPTGRVHADAVVVATNTPFNDRVSIHVKQNAYQTYVVASLIKKGAIPPMLLWDDGDPYHYVRIAEGTDEEHDLLIVGGSDHKTGQEPDPQEHYRAIEEWTREHFPQAGPAAYRWSGEVMEPLDGIAYLGRNPGSKNVYVITGDSGNGISHGTIGGMLVADLILGKQNPWLSIYDPSRKPLKEAVEFIKEQTNIAAQYTDWISSGDEPNAAALLPGEGALIRHGLKKVAVFRDEHGALHCHSAKCPHLGCVVQWNATEQTWDCPCHGSRFSAYGSVLHGPAVSGLATLEDDELQDIIGADKPRVPAGEQPRT
ncbi:MAG TPA: FAD-dependent oxidoreductase [Steroidobacteraceae bacterium]|nr:FAD-dependent oxidoreductase [Steroidobacteraceae bacterium]